MVQKQYSMLESDRHHGQATVSPPVTRRQQNRANEDVDLDCGGSRAQTSKTARRPLAASMRKRGAGRGAGKSFERVGQSAGLRRVGENM